MSKETMEHLNSQTLIGFTEKRGKAWHYRAEMQGDRPNHYEGAIPVEDVIERLFGWTAVEGEVTATAITPDGVLQVTDPTRKAIMRSDTGAILGLFKSGYRVHQYEEWLVQNVETLLDAELAIGSAGVLKGGAQAWVQVEMEDTIEVAGVEYRPFLTAATSMDGSLATTYQTGAQVVVCDNTLSAALRERDAGRIKIRHSVNSFKRITDIRDALDIVHGVADDFAAQVESLRNDLVSEDRWRDFVRAFTKPKTDSKTARTNSERIAGELNQMWRHDERVAPWAGSAWGVVSAVNTWTHHGARVRGASRVERNMERAITGGMDQLDRSTLELLATV